jgi:DNA-binding beta-propeller fold protein YncE
MVIAAKPENATDTRPHALLRAGFPYLTTIGMRRVTWFPVDVAVGKEGRVYTLDRTQNSGGYIRCINWDDEDLGAFGGSELTWPSSFVVDEDENFWITDEAKNQVIVIDREGTLLKSWGEKGSDEGQFDRPGGITFDNDGNVVVSDAINGRVQRYTRDGELLQTIGSQGSGDGELDSPAGLAVDERGDIYVADWGNHRVSQFTADGTFKQTMGKHGSVDGELNRPAGICVDSDGDVYVADWGNNRVVQFDQNGRYVYKFTGNSTLSKMGRRYIETSPRVLRIREMGKLEELEVLRAPRSCLMDSENRLLIPDFGSHRIQVYKKEAYPLTETEIAPVMETVDLYTV